VIPSTATPERSIDLLIIKIPKTTALLVDQLARIRTYVGPLTTSLARKKARLLFPVFDDSLQVPQTTYPETFEDSFLPFPISGHANVFSRDLEQYPVMQRISANHDGSNSHVVDLACGNGVLGLMYQRMYPQAHLRFTDESYSAVDSAKHNYAVWFPEQTVAADQVAIRLFASAKRCLKKGGDLWVVANRHLAYDSRLKRLFGNCKSIAKNGKFAVYRVVQR